MSPIVTVPGRNKAAVLLALLLAGCAAVPSQPLDPRSTAARLEATRASEPRVTAALRDAGFVPAADEAWDLDRLTVVAWTLRPDLAEMRSLRQAAAAGLEASRERPNPLVSLTSEFVRNAATGTSPWTIALAFSWLLENPQKRTARIDQATASVQAAVWSEAQTAWQVRSEVRRAWLSLALAETSLNQARQEAVLRRDFLELTRVRVDAGSWPRPELERAHVAQLQAELQLQQGQDSILVAQGALAAALGMTPAAMQEIRLAASDLAALDAPLPLEWERYREAAIINRLDIAQSLAAYAQADAAWREQLARRWPDLTLGPGYTYDRGDRKLVLGVGGELPLFTHFNAAIAAAAAHREAAAQHVIGVQAGAIADLEAARVGVAGAFAELAILTEARSTQVRAAQATRERWQAGLGDRATWVTASLELTVLERIRLDALKRVTTAIGTLEETIQQPVWPASVLAARPAGER